MQRQNGFYWVKQNCEDNWVIAESRSFKSLSYWVIPGDEQNYYDGEMSEIDETPITRPMQSRKLLSTAQTLATLKETLADFPDTLLLTHVHIEMHNKYSIQITEFNAETSPNFYTQQNEPQKGN